MNPTPEEPKKDALSADTNSDTNTISQELPSEADQAALQAIGALEAESSTINASLADEDEIQESTLPTPDSPYQAAPEAEPIAAALKSPLGEAPVNQPQEPAPKKPSKKVGIIFGVIALVVGAAAATYLILDYMQPAEITQNNTVQSADATQRDPADTESSVKDAATSLDGSAEALDDTMLEDSSLSENTLYQN